MNISLSSLTYETIMRYFLIAIDIIIVWALVNYIIKVAKASQRTIQLFQGVVFILIIRAIAEYFGLKTVAFITNNVVNWGFLAIIIIFQPEIRAMLERIGKNNSLARMTVLSVSEKERLIDELVSATASLSASKTGALISIEQSHSLSEYIQTGVVLNSTVSAELLCSIFMTTTPLHDGAVIIQGDKLACASAYFPPTNIDLPSRYGARHRAAIGISEISDAFTIVVSEETGRVAVTYNGKILQMNEVKLRAFLERIILNKETVNARKSTQTSSDSVTVETLIEQNINNDELDFSTGTGTRKEMKTFQQSDFKGDLPEEKKKPASMSSTIINQVVKDIVGDKNVKQIENTDVAKIKIKTVSTPKNEIHEVSENTTSIKTQQVVDGSVKTSEQEVK